MIIALLIAGGAAAAVATTWAVFAILPRRWQRAAAAAGLALAPWYVILPAASALWPVKDPSCSFFCLSDGEFGSLFFSIGWLPAVLLTAAALAVRGAVRTTGAVRTATARAAVEVRELDPTEIARVRAKLPLTRHATAQTYLVAWHGDEPVGHVHIAWKRTRTPGVPDVHDLAVTRPGGVVEQLLVDAARARARELGYARVDLASK